MSERLYGRDHALAALDEALTAALDGRGGLLLVTGDAGIGKTALAGRLLNSAPASRALVAWAAGAAEGGDLPYWPWVQVLRAITGGQAGEAPPAAASGGLPALPGPLGALLARDGDPLSHEDDRGDRPYERNPDGARFALFDALAEYLAEVGRTVPLVAVLDDLQWCDEPSLRALRFVAGRVRTARILLVGLFRDAEAGPALRELARGAPLVPLAGVDEPAVAELMTGLIGAAPDQELVREVWLRTGGNPFFVRELTRLLGAADGVPEGVRDILDRRLALLSEPCRHLLGTAAVIGREFPVELLARIAAAPAEDVVDLLEEAVGQRILLRPPAPLGRYRFVHDLFRETVTAGLRAGDLARRHLAVADALAASRETGASVSDAQLAAHFAAAGPAAVPQAIRHAALAAAQAAGRLAYEEACTHLDRALTAADLAPDTPAAQRLALLLDLADARYRAGHGPSARDAYRRAADVARSIGDDAALARAAIGMHHLGVRAGSRNPETSALLEEAAALAGTDRRVHALVLAALARDLHNQQAVDAAAVSAEARTTKLATDAVELARETGAPSVLAACLLALHDATWRPGSAADRLPIAREMADQARRAGDVELHAQARQLHAAALLELGDPAAITELAESCRIADELRHPRARWDALTRRATLATLADRLDEAAELLHTALDLGLQIGEPDALALAGTQSWVLSRLGHAVRVPEMALEVYNRRDEPLIVALAAFGSGDRDRAARLLSGYPIADLPRSHDPEPLIFAAAAFAELGPDAAREHLYDLLLPLAGTGSVVGGAAAFQGPIDHYLALLAIALGRHDSAAEHCAAALDFARRLDAPAWVRLTEQLIGSGNLFRREGQVWRLRYAGREALIPDSKGLSDLAALLAAPGREVPAADLLGLPAPGADPVLDQQAQAAYQARLAELADDIDHAEADHDLARAEQARTERDFLVHELAAATGLHGRARRLGDAGEKARKTITARIRYTINRITRAHPELGRHLAASIHTGTRCGYQPPTPTTWHT
ncbi:MAG TPA: AAA family ATPase [Streptosporangiaceae bacterium]|jgi:hypothetical protein